MAAWVLSSASFAQTHCPCWRAGKREGHRLGTITAHCWVLRAVACSPLSSPQANSSINEASEETQNSLLEKTPGIRNSGSNTDLLHGCRQVNYINILRHVTVYNMFFKSAFELILPNLP